MNKNINYSKEQKKIRKILAAHCPDIRIEKNPENPRDFMLIANRNINRDVCVLYTSEEDEITLFFKDWHRHYEAHSKEDYNEFLDDLQGLLANEKCVISITVDGEWRCSILGDVPATEDAMASRGEHVLNQIDETLSEEEAQLKPTDKNKLVITCYYYDAENNIQLAKTEEEEYENCPEENR